MAKKKTFVLRIDPDVYDAIEKWAAQEFRSAKRTDRMDYQQGVT